MFSSCTRLVLCSSVSCPPFINSSLPCNNQYLLCLCQLADGRIMGEEMAGNLLYKLRNTKTRERHHVEEFHSQLGRRQAVLLLFLKEWLTVCNFFQVEIGVQCFCEVTNAFCILSSYRVYDSFFFLTLVAFSSLFSKLYSHFHSFISVIRMCTS